MNNLIIFRNEFFKSLGEKRFKRILVVTFFIALVWSGVDYFVYDNLTFNIKHDIICLLLGTLGERLIPWGKTTSPSL